MWLWKFWYEIQYKNQSKEIKNKIIKSNPLVFKVPDHGASLHHLLQKVNGRKWNNTSKKVILLWTAFWKERHWCRSKICSVKGKYMKY